MAVPAVVITYDRILSGCHDVQVQSWHNLCANPNLGEVDKDDQIPGMTTLAIARPKPPKPQASGVMTTSYFKWLLCLSHRPNAYCSGIPYSLVLAPATSSIAGNSLGLSRESRVITKLYRDQWSMTEEPVRMSISLFQKEKERFDSQRSDLGSDSMVN